MQPHPSFHPPERFLEKVNEDLTKAPGERVNVAHDPAYQPARQPLMKEMIHRIMLHQFPLPPRDLVVIGAH
ncbi:MAG: hypothetical protein HOL51_15145 [Gemmatimonadetes bacterium]|nr:hypothetical protein [Gemmatimonadota bacterium]MBT5327449.1 hypothetical protein [Gemmatimonadota bacterium]MBT5448850.1 hypothetical protein [Gemmatimonadota bacterium]MBT5800824.1 hypothetical protein [Gemmatimonadota bacterium]MBT6618699.1 hypothetical protein [Gemmatimonadota bacterium]